MNFVVRPARAGDAARLAEVAAVTFGLACPPHTTDAAKAAFIAEVLSEARFDGYLADAARDILLAESLDGDGAGGAGSERGDDGVDREHGVRALLGYTMLVHGEPADPDVLAAIRIRPTSELSKCYVRSTHHSSGVAASLMAESIEYARRRGAAALWLGVNEENERAKRFYSKHGFERVGSKHFLVGDNLEDDWVMERAL